MIKRVDPLENLRKEIEDERPRSMSYDLGEGDGKRGWLATVVDKREGKNYSVRIDDSPSIQIHREKGKTLVSLTDANGRPLRDIDDLTGNLREITNASGVVENPHRNLVIDDYMGSSIELTDYPRYDGNTLVLDLEDNKKLTIAEYLRPEPQVRMAA